MKKSLVLFLAQLSLVFTSYAQTLSLIEQQLLKSIDADMPSTIQLLKESVNINSGTFNIVGVKKVGEMYGKELAALGFTVEWVSMPDSLKRAGHLVATKKGNKGKKLFLIGHLDTVFEPDTPPNPFTMLNDSTATGQGIIDMKGGDVMVIAALKAMHKQGLLNDVSITVYFTGDEENTGQPTEISRADFIERAKQHDVALAFESTVAIEKVTTARRGATKWELVIDAQQGHSSLVWGKNGFGAIYEATRIVNEFREQLSLEPNITVNPGLFIGGSDINVNTTTQRGDASGKNNIISPKTFVLGDLRFLTETQKNNAQKMMFEIVSKNLNGATAKIKFQDMIPAMAPTAGNEALAKMFNNISVELGYGDVKPDTKMGGGDVAFVAKYLDSIDGIGAYGKGAHAPGEVMFLNYYPKLIKKATLLIYRLTQ
ncbi:MAG: peptidase M20 [Bacteroidetes bacterium B1(2017)]|nr:MAG: peptidase M20 [Bacteroidetes bacterium B1(2017)]OYU93930.1 MAG: peptidase M20 [Bacteroidetes bacterium B1(2017)]